MYIVPSTIIKILKDVKVDVNYINSIVFGSRDEQYSYFNAKTKYTLNNNTFQRVSRNVCRVNVGIGNLYDCNYLMFTNPSYSNKWFYAFITNVEYVNNDVTEITYEIDAVQTWLLDCNLTNKFFIEREHTSTDNLYEHLIQEEFNVSEYTVSDYSPKIIKGGVGKTSFIAMFMVTEYNEGGTWKQFQIGDMENIVSKIFFVPFYLGESTAMTAFVDQYESAGKIDSILGVYTVPEYALTGIEWTQGVYLNPAITDFASISKNVDVQVSALDGYTPKNKKLLSSPFVMVELTNNCGSSQLFKPENLLITEGKCRFLIEGSFLPNGETHCFPSIYENHVPMNMAVVLSNYPQGVITYDYFQNWWASEKIGFLTRTVNSVITGVAGVVTTAITPKRRLPYYFDTSQRVGVNALASTTNIETGVISEIGKAEQAEIVPSPTIGNASSFNYSVMRGDFDYTVLIRTARSDIAKSIDEYFDLYGYRVDKVKTLELSNRPHWHYVKTRNANFIGNIPQSYREMLGDIFDRGITFWRNGDEIGNYSLDNGVVF